MSGENESGAKKKFTQKNALLLTAILSVCACACLALAWAFLSLLERITTGGGEFLFFFAVITVGLGGILCEIGLGIFLCGSLYLGLLVCGLGSFIFVRYARAKRGKADSGGETVTRKALIIVIVSMAIAVAVIALGIWLAVRWSML